MTDQEIKEAVAKKLGWKHPPHSSKHWHNPKDDDELYDEIPDYCNSIEAAWEIVQFLGNGKWLIFNPANTNTWVAAITDLPNSSDAEAKTAPMAICLAFLKLGSLEG